MNVGVWNGETAVKDGDHYPHGWGLLTYLPEDHLNRREYSGGCPNRGLAKKILNKWTPARHF